MNVAAYALALALSQEPEVPPAESAPEAPAAAAPAAAGTDGTAAPAAPASPAMGRPKGADDVMRLIQKFPTMSEEERALAMAAMLKQYGNAETNPVLPGIDVNLDKYLGLPPAEQAQVVARGFFTDLIAGDPSRLVARAGYPFYLEGRRLDRVEDLRSQWGLSLRSRRTDLLKLYDVQVFLPAEMEKKYGKPPARLNAWNWKAPNTYVAVGNLSGRAAIVLLRQAGAAWQVVGFHD